MELKENIEKILSEYPEFAHLYLVKATLNKLGKTAKASVIIDSDTVLTIDDCTQLSRMINRWAEEKHILPDDYTLEVSSPGAESDLLFLRQYVKNIGRQLKVTKKDQTQVTGTLVQTSAEKIQLEIKQKKTSTTVEIPFEEIKKANVQVAI